MQWLFPRIEERPPRPPPGAARYAHEKCERAAAGSTHDKTPEDYLFDKFVAATPVLTKGKMLDIVQHLHSCRTLPEVGPRVALRLQQRWDLDMPSTPPPPLPHVAPAARPTGDQVNCVGRFHTRAPANFKFASPPSSGSGYALITTGSYFCAAGPDAWIHDSAICSAWRCLQRKLQCGTTSSAAPSASACASSCSTAAGPDRRRARPRTGSRIRLRATRGDGLSDHPGTHGAASQSAERPLLRVRVAADACAAKWDQMSGYKGRVPCRSYRVSVRAAGSHRQLEAAAQGYDASKPGAAGSGSLVAGLLLSPAAALTAMQFPRPSRRAGKAVIEWHIRQEQQRPVLC